MAIRRKTSRSGSYQKTVLKNGLRVVTERIPSVRSVSLGVWIDVGSRHERPKENGVTHFIEHMLFKGTRTRNARQIAGALESLGGSLNGFTSREHTCYTARVLDEHLETAIDVLADMTCRSMFTPVSVKREKKVICEEIKEVEDNPADLVHDIFSATFWGTHPLGQPILGTKKTVLGLTRSDILTYLRQNYRAGSIVVAAAGFVSHSKLIELVKRYFDFPEGTVATPLPARRAGRTRSKLVTDSNSQTHLCIGYPGLAFRDPCKTAALALNAYLGGGMSSVLFQKIREDLGLAYSVFTYHDFYRDSGVVGAYLGTDRKHVRQALDVILTESDRLKGRRLPSARLDQVRSQMKGQLALSLESTSGRMSRLGRQELMGQPYQSYRQLLREVDRLTSSDILDLANRLFDHSQAAITVLGPADKRAFRHAL